MQLNQFIKGGMLLSLGSAIGALCTFGRNIVITRLISVEDYGIAATFGITMALIQMSTGLGVDRLIVQAIDGNEPRLQSTAQAFNILRGVILALVLYVVASPVAHLFNLPEVVWAFQWLAVLPLITSFVHMDSARFQRTMRFTPLVVIESVPQVIAFIVSLPLALYFKDYRVMLWIITIQAVTTVILSFVFAERRFSIRLNKVYLNRIFSFGWPLMLNGLLMFGIFQADRGIVGIAYSMEGLGWFSAAFTLTLFPTIIFMRTAQNLMTPMISRHQNNTAQLELSAVASIKAFLILGMLICVGLGLGGPSLSVVLFGEKYLAGAYIIPWLALMQGIRMIKAGPTTVAIACGMTKLPLYSNMVRSLAIPLALFSVWKGWGVFGIVMSGIAGEVLSFMCFMYLLRRITKVDFSRLYLFYFIIALLITVALFVSLEFVTALNPVLEILGACLFSLFALFLSLVFARDLINWVRTSDRNNDADSVIS